MYSNNLIEKIYEILNYGIKIWVEQENIKVFVPEGIILPDEYKLFIKENKSIILSYLKESLIYTKEYNSFIINSELPYAPLSFSQERLWFIEKYVGGSYAYNIPMVFALADGVKLEILEKAIKAIILRHEVLRTLIKEDEHGTGYQVVLSELDLKKFFQILKLTFSNKIEFEHELTKLSNHVYNLENECPIKVAICNVLDMDSTQKYHMVIVIHHIAFDGWSIDIFLKELYEHYKYYKNLTKDITSSLNLPKLSVQYKDFALWQKCYLKGTRLVELLDFWKNKLSDYETLSLPIDKPRPKEIDYRGNNIYFDLDEVTSKALVDLAKELKVSLYSVLVSGYYLMLRSFSNQDDIIIGTPVANRHYNQVEDLIGFFINTIALRVKINNFLEIKEFIKKVSNELIAAQLHQDLPFGKLVEELCIEKDTSRHPIFHVIFWLQGFSDNIENTSLLERYDTDNTFYNIARFDVSTFIDTISPKIQGHFNYSISLYDAETIKCFIDTYINILKQFANVLIKQNQEKICDIRYLNKDQLLINKYATRHDYLKDNSVHSIFERQVENKPDNIAIIYENTQLTYDELNKKANKLAHFLRSLGVGHDVLVAIILEKSLEMIIGLLAILKAGGTYIPLDSNSPQERLKNILDSTEVSIILTDSKTIDKLPSTFSYTLVIDEDWKKVSTFDTYNPISYVKPHNLAYVIYTSGSTGIPKGVMINHYSLINYFKNIINQISFNCNDKHLMVSEYFFDLGYSSLWGSILSGGELHIVPKSHITSIEIIQKYISQKKINILKTTPSYFQLLLENVILNFKKFSYEIKVILGGEKLTYDIFSLLKTIGAYKKIAIYSHYGPTETTIGVTLGRIMSYDNKAIIGKPMINNIAYVVDKNLNPVPIGGIGELCIVGVNLARGYLNRPDLTAEQFIANPFQTEEEYYNQDIHGRNLRLYRTGDLVRWCSDGSLEYLGRNDLQVKIRGYRIELSEIESILSYYKGIKQIVVAVKAHTDKYGNQTNSKCLIGYYTSADKLDESSIQTYLKTRIPEYMIPSHFIRLDHLPMMLNGKIDRKALTNVALVKEDENIPARNFIEQQICEIWSDVLKIPVNQISITDDFFRLGGDSIISIQLVGKIKQKLGIKVSVKDIFNFKTIEKLYDEITGKEKNDQLSEIKTEQGLLRGAFGLLPIQKRFFQNMFSQQGHWNQSFIVEIAELEINKLISSVKELISYHDAFRLRYKKQDEVGYVQYYDDQAPEEAVKILDIRSLQNEEASKGFDNELELILTNWQSGFNLETGPLYSIAYIYGYKDRKARLHFAMHHLIVDTVSWRILIEDLKNIYQGVTLPPKGSSYRQWVNAVKQYGDSNKNEEGYWKSLISSIELSNKKLEDITNNNTSTNLFSVSINKEDTGRLLKESGKAYNTEINDLLLAALSLTLEKVTGYRVNYITLEGHGREEIDMTLDVNRTVGWFTNIYPVRLEADKSISNLIKSIKEALRQIPNKGIGYGAMVGYDKLPQITFNYLGQINVNVTINKSEWIIVNELTGIPIAPSNKDRNIISINGMVINGCLEFYISSILPPIMIKKLGKLLKSQLLKIIEHCSTNNSIEFTMSDFKEFDPYILFNSEKENNKLFIFPPADGGAESYFNNLAAKLKTAKLVIFNNYYKFLRENIDNETSNLTKVIKQNYYHSIDVPKLVSLYLPYLKFVNNNEPYNLCGWSFGGVLALEAAKQLVIQGEKVRNIIIIDSFFKHKKFFKDYKIKLEAYYHINYKYLPILKNELSNTKILLFKAMKVQKEKDIPGCTLKEIKDINNMYEYYTKKTNFNHLEEVLGNNNFIKIPINSTHSSWIKDNQEIYRICKMMVESKCID